MDADAEREVLALTLAGYMFKQGGTRKSWKKRYFELSEGCINYYKSEDKSKLKGTLHLTEAWGVRGKRDCSCDWPAGTLPSKCFGLALNYRTYYFYSTEEGLEEWAETLQNVIDVIGEPNDDPSKDHVGKPEGNKSKIARSAASLGAKATKVAIKYAPVDDTVKDLVSAGADIVSDQAEAGPDASVADRLKIAAGSADDILEESEDEDGSELASEIAKGIGKAIKKKPIKPPGKALGKVAAKPPGGAKAAGKMAGGLGKAAKGAGKATKGAGKAGDLASKSPTQLAGKATGKAAAKGLTKAAGKGLAKGADKGMGKAAGGALGKGMKAPKGMKVPKGIGKMAGKAAKDKAKKVDVKGIAKSTAKGVLEGLAEDDDDDEEEYDE